MEKIGKIHSKYLERYGIEIESNDIFVHKGTFKHIEKRHPEISNPKEIIKVVLESPDYIGQHTSEPDSVKFVKKIEDNHLVAIKIDKKSSLFIVATTYTITEAKKEKHIKSNRLQIYEEF